MDLSFTGQFRYNLPNKRSVYRVDQNVVVIIVKTDEVLKGFLSC